MEKTQPTQNPEVKNISNNLLQEVNLITGECGTQGIKTYEDVDSVNMVINPNTLVFKRKDREEAYKQQLLQTDQPKINGQFKFNIIMLSSFYFMVCILCLTVNIYNLINDLYSNTVLLQVILLIILIFLGIFIVTLILKYQKLRKKTITLLTIMLSSIQAFLIILDKDILEHFFDEKIQAQLDHSVMLVASLYVSSYSLLSTYAGVSCVSFFSFVLYLIFAVFKNEIAITNICNVLAFGFVAIQFAVFSYRNEKTMRAVFLLMTSNNASNLKQVAFKSETMTKNEKKIINTILEKRMDSHLDQLTEMDKISITLHHVMETLDQASQIIIYKDVQNTLIQAYKDTQNVLKTLISKDNLFKVNIEQKFTREIGITEDDKKFVKEQYQDPVIQNNQLENIHKKRKTNKRQTLLTYDKNSSIIQMEENSNLKNLLQQTGFNWNFDIIQLQNWSNNQSLSKLGNYILKYLLEVESVFQIPESYYQNCLLEIEKSYFKKNPYHNNSHAADVTNSILYFILNSQLKEQLSNLDTFSCVIACVGHDVAHPGLNNRFLVNNQEEIAIRYNDISVLENMHSAITFQTMKNNNQANILQFLPKEDQLYVRKIVIDMILETDMSRHFSTLGKFKSKAINLKSEFTTEKVDDKILILQLLIKSADIGHSSKEWELHYKWSMKVCEEFFQQGDIEKERGQQISMYCDRETTIIPQSQAGFLKFICMPLYDTLCEFLQSEEIENNCLQQIGKNLVKWQQQDFKSSRNKTIGSKSFKSQNSQEVGQIINSKQTCKQQTNEKIDLEFYQINLKNNKAGQSKVQSKENMSKIQNEIIEEKMEDESTHLMMQENSVEVSSNKQDNSKSKEKDNFQDLLDDIKSIQGEQ